MVRNMNWSSSSVAIVSLSLLAPSALLVGCNRPAEMSSATAVPTASETAGTPSESVIPTPGAIAGGESSTSAAEPSDTISLQIADVPQLREQLKNLTGKVVVVDIWSTSCLPCMREFPNLVQLSQRYPDQITCVSFNVDYIGMKSKTPESYTDKVEKFLREQSAVQVVKVI
jgi:thiol-disulfide isomerase/thioredoxin